MRLKNIKKSLTVEVRELIIDLEFARIGILPDRPNYVVLGLCFSFLEPVSICVKCEDNISLNYRGVLRLNKRIFYHCKILEYKIIYWI